MITLNITDFPNRQRQVLENIEKELSAGTLQVGGCLGNELALSKRLDVSRNTIRHVILELEKRGVVRNIARRGIFLDASFQLKNGNGNKNDFKHCFYARWCDSMQEGEISYFLERFACENDLPFKVINVRQSIPTLVKLIDHLSPEEVLLLMPVDTPPVQEALERALERGVRVLQLDRYLSGLKTPVVMFDNYAGAMLGVRYLLQKHGLPVWFYGYKTPVTSLLRYRAWAEAMTDYGFSPEEYIIPCDDEEPDAEQRPNEFYLQCFRDFVKEVPPLPMAVFCLCDRLARNVYIVAEENGLEIGRDFFPVGFDDLPFASRLNPPLTTLRGGSEKLVQAAGEMLLNWPELSDLCRLLPVELIERSGR